MREITYIGNRNKWLGGIFEALGIPSGDSPNFGESDPTEAHLFFNTSTNLLEVWDPSQSVWLVVGAGFDIVNIGTGSPDPGQPNTIQVKSNGEVFFVDKDGDIQQIEFVPVTQVKMSSLLAATATNVINNGAFTQEWQFNMPAGGQGLKITDTRAASGATAETLMSLLITGTGAASRNVTGLAVEVAQPTPGKSGVFTTLDLKLTNLSGTPAFSAPLHAALRIASAAAGIDIISSVLGAKIISSFRALEILGDGHFTGGSGSPSTAAWQFFTGSGKNVETMAITAGTSGTALNLQGRLNVGRLSDVNTLPAWLAIAASTLGLASININEGVAPTTPTNGDIWRTATDIFVRLNGVTYSMIGGGGGGGTELYVSDGTISSNRIVDVNGKTIDFTNVSRFRITDDGSDTGIYDFNNGVDFLVANAVKSFSILTSLAGGIELRAVDISGGGLINKIKINEIETLIETGWLRVPLPSYADNAAAISAGVNNDTLYIAPDGTVRSKQASVTAPSAGGNPPFGLIQNAAYVLTSTTALQKLFDVGTVAGEINVAANTSYEFECVFIITAMSSTAGNAGFSILGAGTATLFSAGWTVIGRDASTLNVQGGAITLYSSSDSESGNLFNASAGTNMHAYIKGIIRVNAAGTIIPSINLTTAAAASVSANSFIKLTKIGNGTVTEF